MGFSIAFSVKRRGGRCREEQDLRLSPRSGFGQSSWERFMAELEELIQKIVDFRDERDWAQFHTPQHLATALSVETAELQELLLWLEDDEVNAKLESGDVRADARREIADVLIYALLFCYELGIDPAEAIENKLRENAEKYPSDVARGTATKYTQLGNEQDPSDSA